MKAKKLFAILIAMLLVMSLCVACGSDDGDNNTGDDGNNGDSGDNGDDTSGEAIEGLMTQASQGCSQYWDTTCEFDWTGTDFADTDTFCSGWVEAYKPTMEQFADGMDMECMQTVMGGFFECMADSCDIDQAWSDCNGEVQANMMGCFQSEV